MLAKNLVVGSRVSVMSSDGKRRLAIGDVVKIFKNAVDIDRIESHGSVGPFGVRRFFLKDVLINNK